MPLQPQRLLRCNRWRRRTACPADGGSVVAKPGRARLARAAAIRDAVAKAAAPSAGSRIRSWMAPPLPTEARGAPLGEGFLKPWLCQLERTTGDAPLGLHHPHRRPRWRSNVDSRFAPLTGEWRTLRDCGRRLGATAAAADSKRHVHVAFRFAETWRVAPSASPTAETPPQNARSPGRAATHDRFDLSTPA